ncbi:hypothetical protein LCGC14_0812170 [marine sediment metagenome]|uniref:Uncharacterized protein n=1 Tax=marine sediment metagenome TaxID=412755 RepID=A0A0F9PQU9_9ZZZZ
MKRPKAKFRIKQVVWARHRGNPLSAPFLVKLDKIGFFNKRWNYTAQLRWFFTSELRPLNKKEREG